MYAPRTKTKRAESLALSDVSQLFAAWSWAAELEDEGAKLRAKVRRLTKQRNWLRIQSKEIAP